MQHIKNSVQLTLNPKPPGTRQKVDKKSRREKDEQAVFDLKLKIPDIENIFDIHGRIGNGTFSTVLLGSLKCEEDIPKERRKLYAIKHLIPTSHPNRILRELKCLIEIGGSDNVVGIDLCLRRNESVAFVMPYLPHDRFQDYFDKMNIVEIQNYLRNLLIAVRRVHNFNIIHRDVKPSNFLYNRKNREFMLVDFGLAQSLLKDKIGSTIPVAITPTIEKSSQDDTSNRKRRISGGSESINQNDIKRVRQEVMPSAIVEPNFKMPLKQINEILTPKPSEKSLKHLEAPLSRQIKSAILGVTMTGRLIEKMDKSKNSPNRNRVNGSNNKVNDGNSAARTTAATTNKYNTNKGQSSTSPAKCFCYGRNQVCNICLIKREIPASRAGTPGYRPPEVLLKYVEQTTAVDIWAVGVIFISILSGVYPFFKAPDDFVALAEIVTIFGDETIRRTAFQLGRQVTMSRKCKALDLRRLCIRLRNRAKIDRSTILTKYEGLGKYPECPNCQQKTFDCLCTNTVFNLEPCGVDIFPSSAYDLLEQLLQVNPHQRITAEDALNHEFFKTNFEQ